METIIKITNCWSWLFADVEVKAKIWKALRFRARNYFHSRLYKTRRWDGYEEFFKKINGQFLTGLLPEVQAALIHLGVNYTLQDHREFPFFVTDNITPKFLDENLVLYDYQCDFVNQVIKYKRGLIMAPTASGKTNVFISCMKAIKEGTPILVLANRTSLVEQNYKELLKWKFKDVGRVYGKHESPGIITCSTVQSLHKIDKLLPHFKALFVDEIHEMMSKSPRKYYNKMVKAAIRVGISATPFKFDGKDKPQKYAVKGYFGPILRTASDLAEDGILTTKKLQEAGTLSAVNAVFYTITEPDLSLQIYQDAVTNGIAANPYLHQVIKRIVPTLSGRTLILVDRIEHGDALHSLIPGSLWVQGKDDQETRSCVIEQLKTSTNVVAIATQQIFNTGLNVYIHNLLNAAGGQAEHLIIQRIGRGLRTADDKEILNYIDFIFEINEYLEDHSWKRVKILEKQGHKVKIIYETP